MSVTIYRRPEARKMDPEYASSLRLELLSKGAAVLTTGSGDRLFLVHSTAMSMAGQGILLAYEPGGVFFWAYATDRLPLNVYRLVGAGFPMEVADAIMAILEGVDIASEMLTHLR
jgi:hypothetical protein